MRTTQAHAPAQDAPGAGDVELEEGFCPRFQQAVELIGRRWTGAILLVMLAGADRYSEIRDGVPGLSDRLLSERLRELEAAGIVDRVVVPEVPVAVRYQLTEKGRALGPVIESLHAWVGRWPGPDSRAEPGAAPPVSA